MIMHTLLNTLVVPWRLVPDAIHSAVLARILSHLLRGQSLAARLRELDGKTVCIHIADVPSRLYFLIAADALRAASPVHVDVTIRGCLEDFWLLATRREDPDTLFFNRRLCIEGDTETGLHIKNLLDALEYDWESHFRNVLGDPIGSMVGRLAHQALTQTPAVNRPASSSSRASRASNRRMGQRT